MFCEYCGSKMEDDSMFCERCGKSVSAAIQAEPIEIEETESVFGAGGYDSVTELDRTVSIEDSSAAEKVQQVPPQEIAETDTEKKCISCGSPLAADARFCDSCGTQVEYAPQNEPVFEEKPASLQKVLCRYCGKELASDARFCDRCGAPTSGTAIPRQYQPSLTGTILKGFFSKPTETLMLAAKKDGLVPGIICFLIKDVILGILAAMLMSKLISEIGILSWFISGEDTFIVAMKVFFAAVIMDVIWSAGLYLTGKVFGGNGTLSAVTGAAGTASLMLSAALIITAVFIAAAPAVTICPLILCLGVIAATAVLILDKVMEVSSEKLLYAVPLLLFVYALVLYFIIYLIVDGNFGVDNYL